MQSRDDTITIKVGALIYYSALPLEAHVRMESFEPDSLEICLVQNRKWGDLWIPPGGGYNPAKDGPLFSHGVYKRTLLREIDEELGLPLKDIVYTKTKIVSPDPKYDGPEREIRFIDFYARAETKDLTLNHATDDIEINAAQWFTLRKIKSNVQIPHSVRECIATFERYLVRKKY